MLSLESLCDGAADTVDLLSNATKQERERRTCAAFLRCARVNFTADQILSSTTEPHVDLDPASALAEMQKAQARLEAAAKR